MTQRKAYTILLVVLSLVLLVHGWGTPAAKVRLDQVQVITLKRGEYTAGRRSSPVPQMSCVGGSGSYMAGDIETVQCKNAGSDGTDIQWKCEADLDSKVRFGKIEVSCEGYDYPEDPYILKGSCGLEYTLELTSQGRTQQQQHNSYQQQNSYQQPHNTYNHQQHNSHTGTSIKTWLMLGIVAFIFYNIYKQCIHMSAYSRTQYGSGGPPPGNTYPPGGNYGHGGGGGGPYGGGSGPYYGDGSSCGAPPPMQAPSWRPGFWTGLGVGGMMGNWWNRPRTHYGTSFFSSGPSSSFARPSFSSMGGGGGSTTRTSSGFGGTRRR